MELKQKIRKGWNISAEGYSRVIEQDFKSERKNAWLDIILDNAPIRDDLKILDAGCGPGFFSIILSEAGLDVTGIDISPEMIKEALNYAEACETDPRFYVMDSQHPDLPHESFDMIVSRNLVWSLTEPEEAYKNWFRLLRPGGKILVFDGDYLIDLREPEAKEEVKYNYDQYAKEYRKKYGRDPECSFAKDTYDIARGWRTHLPLAGEKRPDWDIEVCKKTGYVDVRSEWVNEKIYVNEEDIYLNRNNQYFLISAQKP